MDWLFFGDWSLLGGALLIFALRVLDVSIGTVRSIYTIQGRRRVSIVLGFCESAIFITAVSGVLGGEGGWLHKLAYAGGFAAGIGVGMAVEGWIASGWTMVRVVARDGWQELVDGLRTSGVAVTTVQGEGRDGPVPVLFAVVRRRDAKGVLDRVRTHSPGAFVTTDAVTLASGGTLAVPAVRPRPALLPAMIAGVRPQAGPAGPLGSITPGRTRRRRAA